MVKPKHMDVTLDRITTEKRLGRDPSKAAGLKGAFTLMGPKDHDSIDKLRRDTKAAFTLIELIVVMAVIAILVLLATPKFLNYTQKAKVTQIRNDIKVIENKIDEYLIRHEKFPDTFIPGGTGSGQLYDRTGQIDTAPPNLKVVDETFVPESNLDGDFFVDEDGNVIYEDDKPVTGGGPVVILPPGSDTAIPLGDGTPANPYQIWFLEHLAWIGTDATTLSKSYIAMRDLDFSNDSHYINTAANKPLWTSGAGWTPIGKDGAPFVGQFDGDGKSLTNLMINKPTQDELGLFGAIGLGSVLENYTLLNVDVLGQNNVGGLLGYGYVQNYPAFTVSNVKVYGEVTGSNTVGGLVGYFQAGDILDSYAELTVKGGEEVGGLVGSLYKANIGNSGSKSTILGTILGSYNNGISNVRYVGGLVGEAYQATIRKSYALATITSEPTTNAVDVGGLVGNYEAGTIYDSYAITDVDVPSGGSIGGLVGFSGADVFSSYSVSNLKAGSYLYAGVSEMTGMMGTLIGTHYGNVENSFSAGTVDAPVDAWAADGGIFGDDSGTSVNSTTKSDAEMKAAATYGTWDTSIWDIQAGQYPVLK